MREVLAVVHLGNRVQHNGTKIYSEIIPRLLVWTEIYSHSGTNYTSSLFKVEVTEAEFQLVQIEQKRRQQEKEIRQKLEFLYMTSKNLPINP